MIKIVKEYIWFHYLLTETATYIGTFVIEYISQEVLNKTKVKSIAHNIFRIHNIESMMCGCYCITFLKYMVAGKTLLNYANSFSPNNYKNNDKMIYKYFKDKYGRRSKSWV